VRDQVLYAYKTADKIVTLTKLLVDDRPRGGKKEKEKRKRRKERKRELKRERLHANRQVKESLL